MFQTFGSWLTARNWKFAMRHPSQLFFNKTLINQMFFSIWIFRCETAWKNVKKKTFLPLLFFCSRHKSSKKKKKNDRWVTFYPCRPSSPNVGKGESLANNRPLQHFHVEPPATSFRCVTQIVLHSDTFMNPIVDSVLIVVGGFRSGFTREGLECLTAKDESKTMTLPFNPFWLSRAQHNGVDLELKFDRSLTLSPAFVELVQQALQEVITVSLHPLILSFREWNSHKN